MKLWVQQYIEHVLGLSPRVHIPLHGVRDPAQWRWVDAMRRMGGGRVANPYPADFFPWWRRQSVAIDDYPYGGIYFWGDPDMSLPPGLAYGEIGTKSRLSLFLKFFESFNFFCIFLIMWNQKDMFLHDNT